MKDLEKIIGKPKDDMEKEIAEYITPLFTEDTAKNAADKKRTLSGCCEYCFKKGHKFEVKHGNTGVARVSEEQHWAWVREYFGLASEPAGNTDTDLFESLFG